MKTRLSVVFIFLSILVLSAVSGVAQSSCREAKASNVEQRQDFAIYTVSLPVGDSSVEAKALIPKSDKPLSAVVFSFSTLADSDSDRVAETLPAAIAVAKSGRAAILIQRKLTWHVIDDSVGKMGAAVMCEQQWLAAHARIRPQNWFFVGPDSDNFSFKQLAAVGGAGTTTFRWSFRSANLRMHRRMTAHSAMAC
jgi:hypothetical protein